MIDRSVYKREFFASDGDCLEHNDYKCDECLAASRSTSITLAVSDTRMSTVEKTDALENYRKQTKFIKKALNLTDKGLASKKLKDIPNLMSRAQDEITIGKMGELLEEEYIPTGIIRSIFGFFYRISKRKQR